MKMETLKFLRRGKEYTGEVAFPESVSEALQLVGEKETFLCFIAGYTERQKRHMRRKRGPKKMLRVRISDLSAEQIKGLKDVGILDHTEDYGDT